MKKASNHYQRQKGFTFIEILVAVTIIGVLAAVGAVSYGAANQRARNARRQADLEQIRAALEMYKVDRGAYPATGSLNALASTGYLNPLPSPPPNTKCGGAACTSYNISCVYSATATTYTIKIDLEPSGTYSRTNP